MLSLQRWTRGGLGTFLPALLALLATLSLTACSGKVNPLPLGARVTCGGDSDCPSGFYCASTPDGKVCAERGSIDQTPPSIVPGTGTVTPAVANGATMVTVSFEASEDLSGVPDVRLSGASEALGQPSRSGRVYTLEFQPQTAFGAGTRTIVATLVDRFGNVGQNLLVGQLTLDFDPPTASPPVFSPAYARAGTTFTASITFTEPLGGTPTLGIDGGPALSAAPGPGANEWVFTRTLDGSEPAGPADLRLGAADPAGNVLELRYVAAVTLDFTPPTVASATIGTPSVREGDSLVASLLFSEPLGAPPTVTLVPAGGGAAIPVTVSAIDAGFYALSYDVPLGAADGSYTLTLASAADRAGNPAAGQALGAVTFDSAAPQVTNLTPDHANRLYRATQPVQVSFRLSETPAAAPLVRLELLPSPLPMPCTSAGLVYTCTSPALAGTELPQSVVNVSVTVADPAGNVATAGTSVVLDFTPPVVLSAAPGRTDFAAGSTVGYTVSVSEPLAPGGPTLTVSRGGTAVPGFFGAPSGSATSFAWSRPVPAGQDGAYTVSVVVADEAGNVAAPVAGAGFSVDTSFPAIAGAITVAPAKVAYRASDRPAATFTVSESILAPTAKLNTAPAGINATCTPAGPATTFTCTLDRALAATDLPEGAVAFLITLSDAAGNVGYGSTALTLDYTSPALASAPATRYLGSAATRGIDVRAVGTASSWEISILTAEALSGAPALTAVAPVGGATRTLTLTGSNAPTNTSFTYSLPATPTAHAAATWSVRWSPTDLAGNGYASPQQIATVDVDGVPPAAPASGTAASPQVVWTRTPWGTDTSATPVFRLDATPAAVGTDADVLIAWDGSAAGAREISRATVSGGAFAVPLGSDPAELWVSTLDRAGNESPRMRVVDVAWTASLAGKVPGSTFENPHRLETRTFSTNALVQADAVEVAGSALGVRSDAALVSTTGRALFKPVSGANGPGARRFYGMAADPGRGVVVLYGGQEGSPAFATPGDTWEWDGSAWTKITPVDPEGDGNPPTWDGAPMAYDPVRGGVLLATTNLWLWNGRSWRNLDLGQVAPGLHQNGSMAWDVARGVLVFFGGSYSNVTWEWDGASWRDATPAAPADSPAARSYHQLAWDPIRQHVVVFGGFTLGSAYLNDLAAWDGTRWTQLTTAGTMPGRANHAMAWDPTRSELVVQGGTVAGPLEDGKTYALRTSGSTLTWTDVTPAAGATPFGEHQTTFDARLGKILMFGDWTGAQLLAWDGTARTWSLLAPGDPEGDGNPSYSTFTSRADMVYVPNRLRTVYVESNVRQTWEWDRASWSRRVNGAGPTARTNATIGRYGSNVVLFGGSIFGSSVGDTWVWDGTNWTNPLPSPVRPPSTHLNTLREGAGMINDPTGRLFRFGGNDFFSGGILCYSDMWEWNGAAWSLFPAWNDPENDGSPTGGNGAADSCYSRGRLAWDPGRGSMLFYDWFDVWEYKPGTNSWIRHQMTLLPGSVVPNSSSQAFFWDTTLNSAVVIDDVRAYTVNLTTNQYVPLAIANVYGPVPPSAGMWTFDTGLARAVGLEQVPWTFESGTTSGPAQVFTVDYSRANGPDPAVCVNRPACPIQRIDVTWSGGGTSPTGNGSTLQAWNGEWYDAASNTSTAAAPSVMTWTWTSVSPFPASSLFHGAGRELALAVVPNGATTAAGAAQVASDAVSVTIRYRRP